MTKEMIILNNRKAMERFFDYDQGKTEHPYMHMICLCMGDDNDNCGICPLSKVCGKFDEAEELARELVIGGEFEID